MCASITNINTCGISYNFIMTFKISLHLSKYLVYENEAVFFNDK